MYICISEMLHHCLFSTLSLDSTSSKWTTPDTTNPSTKVWVFCFISHFFLFVFVSKCAKFRSSQRWFFLFANLAKFHYFFCNEGMLQCFLWTVGGGTGSCLGGHGVLASVPQPFFLLHIIYKHCLANWCVPVLVWKWLITIFFLSQKIIMSEEEQTDRMKRNNQRLTTKKKPQVLTTSVQSRSQTSETQEEVRAQSL